MSSVAQSLKTAFLSFVRRRSNEVDRDSEYSEPKTFVQKVRRDYHKGKFDEQIRKAEIDYAEGRALDRLY
jgi:hypothetical protein